MPPDCCAAYLPCNLIPTGESQAESSTGPRIDALAVGSSKWHVQYLARLIRFPTQLDLQASHVPLLTCQRLLLAVIDIEDWTRSAMWKMVASCRFGQPRGLVVSVETKATIPKGNDGDHGQLGLKARINRNLRALPKCRTVFWRAKQLTPKMEPLRNLIPAIYDICGTDFGLKRAQMQRDCRPSWYASIKRSKSGWSYQEQVVC